MIQNQPPKKENATPIQNERSKILIVDDVAANLKLLRDALQTKNIEILVATSGKAVLRTVESAAVDLILLEVIMPEMNGYQVCEKLKQNPATADIPVIFVTAKGEIESIVQGFEVGGVDYIRKPFEGPEVLARVKLTSKRCNSSRHSNKRIVPLLQKSHGVNRPKPTATSLMISGREPTKDCR